MWVIRDGPRKISTGCAAKDRAGAERALGEHLADKYRPSRKRGRHPSEILIADVLAIYLADVAPRHARENETKQRVLTLDAWWGERVVSFNEDTYYVYTLKDGRLLGTAKKLD